MLSFILCVVPVVLVGGRMADEGRSLYEAQWTVPRGVMRQSLHSSRVFRD